MLKLSINLPLKRRVDLSLVRERGAVDEPLLISIPELRRTRRGNKLSRYFRHIFEHKSLRKLLGSNLALVAIAGTLVSGNQAVLANSDLEAENAAVITVQTPPLNTEQGVIYPVQKVKINQGYRFFHPGVDLDGETGDAVRPIMAGKVEKIERARFAYGNSIIINHGNGIKSRYAHLSKIAVVEGQKVTHTTEIGQVGSTGWSTGSHLHLEVYEGERTINPLSVLPKR
jgi:murein DD-endopeptidase MepM/ murein hydrolase activator NlpD